jgi:dTDP-4-dehydrorhamnose 3,5-epimerase
MRFIETPLAGAFVIEAERFEDARGFFARTFCEREFDQRGLNGHVAQTNLSYNERRGTLRGMHYQRPPHAEAKLVRCTRGAIHDVVIDLRPASATYLDHFAVRLDEDNRSMLYIPEGLAHGFLTLADRTEVAYQMSVAYSPDHGAGVRWDDPAFGIRWPEPVRVIIDRDRSYPDYVHQP